MTEAYAQSEVPVRHQGAILWIILASYLIIAVNISIVLTALPAIQTELGLTTTGVSWVQNASTLTFGGLLLLGARGGDILRRRRIFVLGVALFTVPPWR